MANPDEWAELCSSCFVPLRVRASSPGFRAALTHVALPRELGATRVTSDGSEVFRSAKRIAVDPSDDLLLSVQVSGSGVVRQSERQAVLGRGVATLYDTASPYTLLFPARMSELVLQMPRAVIDPRGRAVAGSTARTIGPSPALRALTALLGSVTAGDVATPREQLALADAVVGLARSVLSPVLREDRPTGLDRDALYASMLTAIDDGLADPDLSVSSIAAAHAVSVRLVQKIFADHGGSPADLIRRRRLEYASDLLAAGRGVAESARRSGFSDAGTFARAFRRRFGVVPSEWS